MNDAERIEEMCKTVVQRVRDESIRNCDALLALQAASPIAKKWKTAISEGNTEKLADLLIADVVDAVLFCFMDALDNGLLDITYHASDDQSVRVTSHAKGELAGWYIGHDGLIARYSSERLSTIPSDDWGRGTR